MQDASVPRYGTEDGQDDSEDRLGVPVEHQWGNDHDDGSFPQSEESVIDEWASQYKE